MKPTIKAARKYRQCGSKHRYDTEFEAGKAVTKYMRQRPNQHQLRVYDCTYCNGWHITSSAIEGGEG